MVPSTAHAAYTDYNPGVGCVWTGPNAGGAIAKLIIGSYGTSCHNFSSIFDNNIQSAYHSYGSGRKLFLFTEPNCGGLNFASINYGVMYSWSTNTEFSSFRIL